ncbi:MAG: hypothetical protein IPF99_02160 [Deltaproteobacteria bacterium]|nr:hypothetical protein [Deltaproteobacteria bacterium]
MRAPRLLAAAAVLVVACNRAPGETPKATVEAFAHAAQSARTDSSARQRMYDLLSQRAQDALTDRAQQASQLSGWELQPWEMIAPGRIHLRLEIDPSSMDTRISDDRAVVTVRGVAGGVADVPLVREGGRWRIDLSFPSVEAIRPGAGDAGARSVP